MTVTLEDIGKEVKDTLDVFKKASDEDRAKIAGVEKIAKELAENVEREKAFKAEVERELKELRDAVKFFRETRQTVPLLPNDVFGRDKAKAFCDFARYAICTTMGRPIPKDIDVKAFDGQTDAGGAVLIPDTFHPEILSILNQVGVFQTICEQMPIGPGKNTWPHDKDGVVLGWHGWGSALSEASPSVEPIDLTAQDLGAIILVPNQMLEQSSADIGNYIARKFIRAFAKEEERVLVKGTGIPNDGKITGVLRSTNVTEANMASTKDAFADLAWDDLVDMEGALTVGDDVRYVLSRSVLALAKKLKDSGNLPIWHAPAGPEPATINGHPYTIVNQYPRQADTAVSTRFISLGDHRMGVKYGRVGALRIESSREYKFGNNQTAFRAIEGFAGQVIPGSETGENPVVVLETAAS